MGIEREGAENAWRPTCTYQVIKQGRAIVVTSPLRTFPFYKQESWGQRDSKTCSLAPLFLRNAVGTVPTQCREAELRMLAEANLNPGPTQPVPAGSAWLPGPCYPSV